MDTADMSNVSFPLTPTMMGNVIKCQYMCDFPQTTVKTSYFTVSCVTYMTSSKTYVLCCKNVSTDLQSLQQYHMAASGTVKQIEKYLTVCFCVSRLARCPARVPAWAFRGGGPQLRGMQLGGRAALPQQRLLVPVLSPLPRMQLSLR